MPILLFAPRPEAQVQILTPTPVPPGEPATIPGPLTQLIVQPVSQTLSLQQWFGQSWPSLVEALLTAAVALVALRLTRRWLGSALERARVDRGTRILVTRSVSIGIVVFATLAVLESLRVSPTTVLAAIGAVGLAFSLALQDILKNFFSGVYLLLERPFRVGDVIKVKEIQGTVEHVGVRTTMLRTADNVVVIVPNASVIAEVVTNHTYARPAGPVAHAPPTEPLPAPGPGLGAAPPAELSSAPAPVAATARPAGPPAS